VTSRRVLTGMASLALVLTCVTNALAEDASKKKERAHSHLIQARRFAAEYKIEKAAAKARDALTDDPNLAEAHVYLGLERFRANDLKTAEAEFTRALELDGYLAEAHCELGYLLYQKGEIESATDHWTLASRLDPTSPLALAGLALAQFKHGQEKDALKSFEKALIYDHRLRDPRFVESENGPKWSGRLLEDFKLLVSKASGPAS
jgi:tetratricopeptide (TPR) repeat protein